MTENTLFDHSVVFIVAWWLNLMLVQSMGPMTSGRPEERKSWTWGPVLPSLLWLLAGDGETHVVGSQLSYCSCDPVYDPAGSWFVDGKCVANCLLWKLPQLHKAAGSSGVDSLDWRAQRSPFHPLVQLQSAQPVRPTIKLVRNRSVNGLI